MAELTSDYRPTHANNPSEVEMLRAEIQALRQSVWNIEQVVLSQDALSNDKEHLPARVTVANVNIGFWAMVNLLVTAAIASIPALVILFFVGLLVIAILGSIGGLLPAFLSGILS
ncbi:MAG: hypothetical protein WBO46_03235 [Caldilineaceae bacterium]